MNARAHEALAQLDVEPDEIIRFEEMLIVRVESKSRHGIEEDVERGGYDVM